MKCIHLSCKKQAFFVKTKVRMCYSSGMRKVVYLVLISVVVSGCVPADMQYHSRKNYKSYVSSSVDEKSYVSATPTDKELVSAFEEAQRDEQHILHQTLFVEGWVKPRGEASGLVLKDEESRERLDDALNSTPLGSDAKWNKGSVTFILTPNSTIYKAYKSGGVCRDVELIIYDDISEEVTRGLFCKKGVASGWIRL